MAWALTMRVLQAYRLAKEFIRADLYRYHGSHDRFFKTYFLTPGFKYSVWLRIVMALDQCHCRILKWVFIPKLLAVGAKYGIDIAYQAQIGKGLYIGHFTGIFIHEKVKMGQDCNLSQGVTIGYSPRGSKAGCPQIGDRVYFGPGAKVFGGIQVGDDVAIGANAVVSFDLDKAAVAAPQRSQIIHHKGSGAFCIHLTGDL